MFGILNMVMGKAEYFLRPRDTGDELTGVLLKFPYKLKGYEVKLVNNLGDLIKVAQKRKGSKAKRMVQIITVCRSYGARLESISCGSGYTDVGIVIRKSLQSLLFNKLYDAKVLR